MNCSYRKTGIREAQPDASYYVGDAALQPLHERATLAPQGSTITNLDETPAPDLAIEVADSSLDADLGKKRLLYEEMAIAEYWVVDVENAQIVAFQIASNGSRRIDQSQVLPGLEMAVLCEAMIRRRQLDDSQGVAWLLSTFQA